MDRPATSRLSTACQVGSGDADTGLPVETYLETGGRSAFDNDNYAIQLHPEFAQPEDRVAMVWDSFGFAPLIGDSTLLERVRSKLRLQCELLRHSRVPSATQLC